MLDALDGFPLGTRFGRLTVTGWGYIPNGRKRARGVACACDCGALRVVAPAKLRSGRTTSCGCASRERGSALGRSRRTHGHNARNSPTYRSWMTMVQRCENPNHDAYARYGGRGIVICERWRREGGFERFLADMGPRPDGRSIDRIDNDKDYEPSNCRWSTPAEQSRNRRNVALT